MPYIIVYSSEGDEVTRRELADLVIIGRSPDCDVRIHDILMSREHCGIEQNDDGWIVVDLDSRNGTYVNGERIGRQILADADQISLGRCKVCFFVGAIEDAPPPRRMGLLERPSDPFEALANTVTDFTFDPKFEPPVDRPIIRPMPRPMPVASKMRACVSPVAVMAHPENEVGSSPTWATKPQAAPIRSALDRTLHLPEPRIAPRRAPEAVEQAQATPSQWSRRIALRIGELFAAAALTATVLLTVMALLAR